MPRGEALRAAQRTWATAQAAWAVAMRGGRPHLEGALSR